MNSKFFFLSAVLLSMGLISTCTNENNMITPQDEIRGLWDQFIIDWESEDAAACASLYFANGFNVPNESPVNHGIEEIEVFYRSLFDNNASSRYVHVIESLSHDGDIAVEYSSFSVNWISNEGEEWTYEARTLVHWEKDENRDWKIKTFLFNQPNLDQD